MLLARILARLTTVTEGLDFRVLGPVEVLRDGRPLPLGGPKPRLLLALLLAHRGSVLSTDRLCEELWGDAQPASPTAVLQSVVSRLRSLLRPEAEIVARAPGYLLQVDELRVDAGRFDIACTTADLEADPTAAADALTGALALWRGGAFEEFADRDWGRAVAVRLDESRTKAREDMIDARLAVGAHAEVVGELEALVAEHPLRERPWQQLIVALHRSGRSADALRRAAAHRELLRDELGLEPSSSLRELESLVLTDDPALRAPDLASSGKRPLQLPTSATRLIGRDADLDELMTELTAHRLVTLTGPGGVGKTRLALQLADRLVDRGEGVFFVELAPVHEPASTVAAIATAVGVQPRQLLSTEETLVEYLRPRRGWMVLDNCEHLRASVALLVGRLLAWCAELRVVVTTREVLGLAGEKVCRVEPLGMAPPGAALAEIAAAPAVQMFVERAAAARSGFALDDGNVEAVVEIVQRVDALPLGIELAAARMRALSPTALAERLRGPHDLLDGAQASAVPRHRTLHDLVTWSYALLEPDEQRLFARLSVFAGSFGLDAAEAIGADESSSANDVSVLLANLVDKSMVQLVDDDRSRYRLLETLREFAAAQLDAAERSALQERHARWFLAAATRAARELGGPAEAAAMRGLDRDFDNLRATQQWALEHGDVDVSLRLVAALREYAFRGMHAEVVDWADDASGLPGVAEHPRAPVVMATAAYGRFVRGDLEAAIELGQRAVALAESLDTDASGLAERALGNAFFYRGDVASATDWMDRMLESARSGSSARLTHALYMRSVAFTSVGDPVRGAQLAGEAAAEARRGGSPTGHAEAEYALGLALESSHPDEAAEHLRHARDLAHEAGNRWVEAFALTEVLWLQARQGDAREALARYEDVVDIWYRGGDWANQWLSLRHVFGILVELHADEGAATLHGALVAAGAAYALPFEAADAERLERLVGELRERLGASAFAAAVRRGAALDDAEIIELVRGQIRAIAP
jgi:predicted ATPase